MCMGLGPAGYPHVFAKACRSYDMVFKLKGIAAVEGASRLLLSYCHRLFKGAPPPPTQFLGVVARDCISKTITDTRKKPTTV